MASPRVRRARRILRNKAVINKNHREKEGKAQEVEEEFIFTFAFDNEELEIINPSEIPTQDIETANIEKPKPSRAKGRPKK